MVSYFSIKKKTLCVGDVFLLWGIKYQVRHSSFDGYYLYKTIDSPGIDNDAVFYVLGIDNEEKYRLAKSFRSDGILCSGYFPYMDTLDALTKFVIYLFEYQKYKVGDWVSISERKYASGAYPFFYTEDMAKLAGQKFRIKDVDIASFDISDCPQYSGDIHRYRLDGNAAEYKWHSSMFSNVGVSHYDIKIDFPTTGCSSEKNEESPILTLPKKRKITEIRL